MLQIGNKLVMNNLIVKILENIFRESYSEIESKIISETNIKDNPTMEENRFIFFIRCALLDFVFMFIYLMPKVLDRDMLKQSYIVECLSPVLRAFHNAFPDVKYMWLEKDVKSIKEANLIFTSNFGERKTDLFILSIQIIGDRLTLFTVSLASKRKYLAVELASFIRNEFLEQEKLQRKIRAFIPTDNYSENLREWLHLPDDDISLVTEEDMDEIFL
ncbi:hypothetical protein C2G38_2206778 [Gigaspora rosea]|uniref:Uncharacterized protein n=1 Tax=Gigaspora rosea TaxID=44941 RepID=A0A397UIT2_9GLOM|nr:hypothetical protein C2G38_2206778 [Gigaspora rosea]